MKEFIYFNTQFVHVILIQAVMMCYRNLSSLFIKYVVFRLVDVKQKPNALLTFDLKVSVVFNRNFSRVCVLFFFFFYKSLIIELENV